MLALVESPKSCWGVVPAFGLSGVLGLGFRVWGLRFRFKVWGLGFRMREVRFGWGFGCRVWWRFLHAGRNDVCRDQALVAHRAAYGSP